MKNTLPKTLLIAFAFFVFSTSSVLAAAPAVTSIGALDTSGSKVSGQWWYTSTNPTLKGTASANTTISINIDGSESTVMSDATGNWQFYSDKLTNGNHQITISANGESTSFSLNIGQEVPEGTGSVTGKGGLPVPITGSSDLILYVGISIVLLAGGALVYSRRR